MTVFWVSRIPCSYGRVPVTIIFANYGLQTPTAAGPSRNQVVERAKVRDRFHRDGCGSSSVVAAVLSEAVFNHLCKSGVRLPGGRYEVDAFEE